MIIPHRHSTRSAGTRARLTVSVVAVVTTVALIALVMTKPSSPTVSRPASAPQHENTADTGQKRGTVRFVGSKGQEKSRLSVEIVDNEHSRELGLMYRRTMGADYGMLFVFDSAAVQSFWMKNTFIALDMIFVDEHGKIVTILPDAVPHSLEPRSSTAPALYVVEVNAGYAARHALRVGDRMIREGASS